MSTSGGGCGSLDKATKAYMFEYQNLDYITTSVVPIIVINTWYTALAETDDVKAYYLIVEQTNNGAANEDIEVALTVNGTAITPFSTNMVDATPYYVRLGIAATGSCQAAATQILALDDDHSAPLETRSLVIAVRQTSVVDVVAAQIEVNMVYETLQAT